MAHWRQMYIWGIRATVETGGIVSKFLEMATSISPPSRKKRWRKSRGAAAAAATQRRRRIGWDDLNVGVVAVVSFCRPKISCQRPLSPTETLFLGNEVD